MLNTLNSINVAGEAIVVSTNGFVWHARQIMDSDGYLTLVKARIIRRWGTSIGLAQLVTGPTSETVLDAESTVIIAKQALIFVIPTQAWPK
jgi:hypothetical protein